MNKNKQTKFMEAITPVLTKLASWWFEPGEKVMHEGEEYSRGCGYCDLNCSRDDKHDDDCLVQLAKNTLEEWDKIQGSDKWKKCWSKEEGWDAIRSPEDVQQGKDMNKYWTFFSHFLKHTSFDMLVPLDYEDPANNHTCCTCSWAAKSRKEMRRCQPDCPNFLIAGALSDLYKPNSHSISDT